MGLYKIRQKAKFMDGLTATGSAGFSGRVNLSGGLAMTTGSAAAQYAGVLRINSGAVSATASTTVINSGGFPILQPIAIGVGVASYQLIGQIVVTTVAQAASGGYFSVGFSGAQNGLGMHVDVGWFIVNPV